MICGISQASERQDLRLDARTQISRYLTFFGGRSLLIFGSEDRRTVAGASFGYGRPEPKFRLWSIPAQLVYELTISPTWSRGIDKDPPNVSWNYGLLGIARYRWPQKADGAGFYVDLGFGVLQAGRATHDLPSRTNTTPMLGFGFAFPRAGHEFLLGVRLLHISNAGTEGQHRGDNRGQNQLMGTLTYRF